jgi:branched-chain amino acid aminotransferase
MTLDDFDKADEIFCTGNIAKVMPVAKYQDRIMSECPMSLRAREIYWDYSHSRYNQKDVA